MEVYVVMCFNVLVKRKRTERANRIQKIQIFTGENIYSNHKEVAGASKMLKKNVSDLFRFDAFTPVLILLEKYVLYFLIFYILCFIFLKMLCFIFINIVYFIFFKYFLKH